jgi:hypothetical protein
VLGALAMALGIEPLTTRAAGAAVAAAASLDLLLVWTGRPTPWSVRQQVPRLWARIFPLAGATILYGLRLGVGPLTILRSWLWWAGTFVAATVGAWPSAVAGAVFGVARIAVQLAAVWRAEPAMPARMARVIALERACSGPVLAALLVGSTALAIGG